MAKQVLDVGQCGFDHSNICRVLTSNFDVEVHQAKSHDEAISMAKEKTFDLILINRLLDTDGSRGMQVLETLRSDSSTSTIPVMVVSNYEEAQVEAMKAGALRGFGKSSLHTDETLDLLKEHLQ